MQAKTYAVVGMSCEHCALSVREEVSAVAGVEKADVDVAAARVVVRGVGVSEAAVKAAVEAAGYALASPGRS